MIVSPSLPARVENEPKTATLCPVGPNFQSLEKDVEQKVARTAGWVSCCSQYLWSKCQVGINLSKCQAASYAHMRKHVGRHPLYQALISVFSSRACMSDRPLLQGNSLWSLLCNFESESYKAPVWCGMAPSVCPVQEKQPQEDPKEKNPGKFPHASAASFLSNSLTDGATSGSHLTTGCSIPICFTRLPPLILKACVGTKLDSLCKGQAHNWCQFLQLQIGLNRRSR